MTASASRLSVRPRALLGPLGVWVLLAMLAVANGAFRELVLIPRVGEYPAHVLSTGLLLAIIIVVSFAFFSRSATAYTRTELVLVGVAWAALTVGFEFVVGALEGTPVSETLAQYDVLAGQVWVLVPLTLLVAPPVFGRYLARSATDD